MKTPQITPKKGVNYGQWTAIIVLALTVLGYAFMSYGKQEKFNEDIQKTVDQLQREKVNQEVFIITIQNIDKQLIDIKTNTDQIPDLKAKIEARINKDQN